MGQLVTQPGWYYKAGDPSVGLYGGGWVHDACPAAAFVDECRDAKEDFVKADRKNAETMTITMRVTCAECGESFVYSFDDWDPLECEVENPMANPRDRDDLLPVLRFGVRNQQNWLRRIVDAMRTGVGGWR